MSSIETPITVLERALKANRHLDFTRYYTLATIHFDEENIPHANARTMEYRQFEMQTNSIVSCVDLRTAVISQSIHGGEVCWYFPLTREQFRMQVDISIISNDTKDNDDDDNNNNTNNMHQLRHNIWKSLSNPSRALFDRRSPGQRQESTVILGDLDRFDPQPANCKIPCPNFGIILLHIKRCDYIRLPKQLDITKPQRFESTIQPARSTLRTLHEYDSDTNTYRVSRIHP